MMQYREQILAYAIQYKGDWYKMREAIKENKAWNLPACSCTYVTIVDPTYPCKFRRLQCPPWILFYEGNLALCEQRSVAVIGSRQPRDVDWMCIIRKLMPIFNKSWPKSNWS